jgi:putative transposase
MRFGRRGSLASGVPVRSGAAGGQIDLPLPFQTDREGHSDEADQGRSPKPVCATYGYRRIHVLLRREGWQVNANRVCRRYREMGLQLRNKSPKRRVKAQLREDRSPAIAANQVWAMDFVHDQLFDDRKIRVLTGKLSGGSKWPFRPRSNAISIVPSFLIIVFE